jgi:hypothetical protein
MTSEMRPDLLEAMADFAELERLQAERRSGRRTFGHEIGMSDERLAAAFELMERHVQEGLTLTASACLAGVTRRTLAAWVKLADDRRAPWAGWFDVLMRGNADNRRLVLADLRKLAALDSKAFRDLANQLGRPSPLEYEIEGLRRSKTAALDVLVMPTDADRNGKAGGLRPTASAGLEGETP